MKEIPLSQGKFTLVDDEYYCFLNQFKWYYCHGYAVRKSRDKPHKNIYMHKVILGVPYGMEGDHIDRNRLNNCRSNLRVCTRSENIRNRSIQKNNKSGFVGVNLYKRINKWRACINVFGSQIHLGYFDDPVEAAKVRDAAAIKYHGEFAKTNF